VEIRIVDCFQSGEFAELAFLHAPVGLVVTENRVIRDCNPAFATMFGYDRDDLRNCLFSILYPTQDEFTNIRIVLMGFPLYLLPEKAKSQLVLNAVEWMLAP